MLFAWFVKLASSAALARNNIVTGIKCEIYFGAGTKLTIIVVCCIALVGLEDGPVESLRLSLMITSVCQTGHPCHGPNGGPCYMHTAAR